MAKRDFYETLGVSKTATEAELKSAFRKAAMQCHPDRHPGDKQAEARFKELNEAYQHLSDAQKRAAYDRYGHAAFEHGSGMNDGFAASMSDIFEDLFGDMMGGAARPPARRAERGADLRYNLEITLEEAFRGKTATIKMPTSVTCEACAGSGARAGSKTRDLQDLRRPWARARAAGLLRHRTHLPDLPRPRPDDRQSVRQMRRLGARDARAHALGQCSCRRRGRHAHPSDRRGRGGHARRPPGDLYIFLSVKPHPIFQRDGADLYCRVPISMVQAALGGEFTVRTLDGARVEGHHPRGGAVGPAAADCAARACRSCARATSATCLSSSTSRRRRT